MKSQTISFDLNNLNESLWLSISEEERRKFFDAIEAWHHPEECLDPEYRDIHGCVENEYLAVFIDTEEGLKYWDTVYIL